MSDTFINQLKAFGCALQQGLGLNPKPKPLPSAKDVSDWWAGFIDMPITGWAQFSDANVIIQKGQWSKQPTGLLLAAEFYLGDISFQLRPTGNGWVAAEITKTSDPSSYLETLQLLADDKSKTGLTYQVAWRSAPLDKPAKPGEPARPIASRLVSTPKA